MGNVWKFFCADFADHDGHGSPVGSSDGFVATASAGASTTSGSSSSRNNHYEPNSHSRIAIYAIVVSAISSTDAYQRCFGTACSTISDRWNPTTGADSAPWNSTCDPGVANRVL